MRRAAVPMFLIVAAVAGCAEPEDGLDDLGQLYPGTAREGDVWRLGGVVLVSVDGGDPERLVHFNVTVPPVVMPDRDAALPTDDVVELRIPDVDVVARFARQERLVGYSAEWGLTAGEQDRVILGRVPAEQDFAFTLHQPETAYLDARLYLDDELVAYVGSPAGLFPTAFWTYEGAVAPRTLGPIEQPAMDRFVLPSDSDLPTMAAASSLLAAAGVSTVQGTDVDLVLRDVEGEVLACSRQVPGSAPAPGDAEESLNHSTFASFAPVPWTLDVGSLGEACDGVEPSYANPGPVRYSLRIAYIGR